MWNIVAPVSQRATKNVTVAKTKLGQQNVSKDALLYFPVFVAREWLLGIN